MQGGASHTSTPSAARTYLSRYSSQGQEHTYYRRFVPSKLSVCIPCLVQFTAVKHVYIFYPNPFSAFHRDHSLQCSLILLSQPAHPSLASGLPCCSSKLLEVQRCTELCKEAEMMKLLVKFEFIQQPEGKIKRRNDAKVLFCNSCLV